MPSTPLCVFTELKPFCFLCLRSQPWKCSSKIPAIPSSRWEAAMWAGPCTATSPLHHQTSSCNSRLGRRLAFTRNAGLQFCQGGSVGSLACWGRVSFHFSVQLVKGFLETRSLHFTWVCLSAKSCFKLLFPCHIKRILR